MKTCRDCIHYEVCQDGSYRQSTCDSFKDKSRFIELPCSIGDTVYKIYYNKSACNECPNKYSLFYDEDCMCAKRKTMLPSVYDNKNIICDKHYLNITEYKPSLEWIVWQLDKFGKTVFLTREEAEKKMEELNNDGNI